jgi:hypothetical protein
MTRRPASAILGGILCITLVACGTSTPSQAPSPTVLTPSPAAPASTGAPAPTATPLSTVPTTPSPTDCPFNPQAGLLPSDRLTDVRVESGADADRLVFVFDAPSIGSPAGPPRGSLSIAPTPYTFAGSGETIDMTGGHVLLMRFAHMSLANDVGQETYLGPREIAPDLPALRQAVLFDESEGILGWYVGYDGPGCVALAQDGSSVTLTIEHP